ncbi:MAG: DUF481 domain-containing protein [Candidatus Margulisiibacteriota bacterium]
MRFVCLLLTILIFGAGISPAETTIERKVSLGGQQTGGNTAVQSLHMDFKLNRNRKWVDETTIKGSLDQEFSAGAETQNKASGSGRFARSINKQFFHYAKLQAEHDRFQDLNIRIIPTIGFGYWFHEDDIFKSTLEGALGYQKEYLISGGVNETALVTVSSDILWGVFTNNLDVYASATDLDNYRFTNESKLKIKLNTHYSFKLSLKDEYNNRPAAGVQKNDAAFTTGLEFAFKETKS